MFSTLVSTALLLYLRIAGHDQRKNQNMKDIIELLQNERIKSVDALKRGEQHKLPYLQQIDKALGWLKAVEDNALENVGNYDIHRLPDPLFGFSYYHLMVDYESGDPRDWKEYKPNDQSLELCFDDIVIKHKSR